MIVQAMPYPPSVAAGLQFVGGKVALLDLPTSPDDLVSLTDLTGGIASAPASGDLVIAAVGFNGSGNFAWSIDTAGYTQVADLFGDDTIDTNLWVHYKRLTAADTNFHVAGGNGSVTIAVHVWRGSDSTTPLDVTTTTATGINSGLPNPPSITPVTAGAVVVAVGQGGFQNSAPFTSPDLENFISNGFEAGTADPAIGIGSIEWPGSGAVDPAAWSGTTSTAAAWAAACLAIRPA